MSIKLIKQNDILNIPFELHTGNRKLNYTSEYDYGRLFKVGNLVNFAISWKGLIQESGEYAYIKIPYLLENPPLIDTPCTIGEYSRCISDNPISLFGVIRASNGLIALYDSAGNITKWNSEIKSQFLKLSGTYICN